MKLSELIKKLGVEIELDEKQDVEVEGFIPKERFDEVNSKSKELEKQLEETNKQVKELENFKGTAEEYEGKLKELNQTIQEKEKEYQNNLKQTQINAAIEKELISNRAKSDYVDFLKSKIDKDTIKVTDEGVMGIKEQLDSLKESQKLMFGEEKPTGEPPKDGEPNEPKQEDPFLKGLNQEY